MTDAMMPSDEDCRKWVALYWTLAVPWAQHTDLPDDVDDAAKKSVTIRYQRDLVRRRMPHIGGSLIREFVFMEPDQFRPGAGVLSKLDEIEQLCLQERAGFLYVKFGGPARVRYHGELEARVSHGFYRKGIPFRGLDVDKADGCEPDAGADYGFESRSMLSMGGLPAGAKDIYDHFKKWRKAHEDRRRDRDQRVSNLLETAAALRGRGDTLVQIASQLNEQDMRSTTGRDWTAESLRKFLRRTGVGEGR